jgi:hypothetical protein
VLAVLVAALLLGLPSCRPRDENPQVQRALSAYAPDLKLGGRVGGAARRRYHLMVAPYLGYRDSTFRTTDGLKDLGIKVDEYVDDGDRHVSPSARIEQVILGSPDSASSRRAESRLRAMLGTPREVCYSAWRAGPWRRLSWPGQQGRGVQLRVVLPRYFNPPAARTSALPAWAEGGPPGSGIILFGVREPDDKSVQIVRCPAHLQW